MLYCVQALHLSRGQSYSKHAAAIAAFGRQFVKSGLFDARYHEDLRKAFEDRQMSDYEALEAPSADSARTHLARSREFLEVVEVFLQRQPGA